MSTVQLDDSQRRRLRPYRRRAVTGLLVLAVVALLVRRAAPEPSALSSSPPTSSTPRGAVHGPSPSSSPVTTPMRARKPAATRTVLLNVPLMSQLPSLPNGCEVTSLAMLLTAAGLPADKNQLAREQKTNPAQPVFRPGAEGNLTQIQSWGDPRLAFVGNVDKKYGYGIYHGPLSQLLFMKAGTRGQDLTGRDFTTLLNLIDHGQAVMIWATTTLRPTNNWVTWQGPAGPVRATFNEHAVVLVGHTGDKLIINNPLSGRRETVAAKPLIAAWRQLGSQALSVAAAK